MTLSRLATLTLVASLLAGVAPGCDVANGAVVRNASGERLDRVRLVVGAEAFTLGPLATGESATVSFVPTRDESLTLCVDRGRGEACADYGYVTLNLVQAHRFDVLPDRVRYTFD